MVENKLAVSESSNKKSITINKNGFKYKTPKGPNSIKKSRNQEYTVPYIHWDKIVQFKCQ